MEISTISADQAYQMVQENKCNLIDIRELNELELTGRVEGANHIPMGNLETLLDPNSDVFKNGQIDKNKEVVLFCAGGVRSEMSVKSLTKKGFKNISHIEGGFGSIINSSFKIV
ncbi:rhodanese-like domain-containing protein [Candidatus Pelagibacter sp. HIMB1509]|uniref:rhodanese-like domain-containing protein n=1 Tax=Candidatus Pelagibacter sp. HIMB1509 TaxID=3413339 RepID=UPI003F871F97